MYLYTPLLSAEDTVPPTELVGGVAIAGALGTASIVGLGILTAEAHAGAIGYCAGLQAVSSPPAAVALSASLATALLVDGALAFEGGVALAGALATARLLDANGGFLAGVGVSSSIAYLTFPILNGQSSPPQVTASAGRSARRLSRGVLCR